VVRIFVESHVEDVGSRGGRAEHATLSAQELVLPDLAQAGADLITRVGRVNAEWNTSEGKRRTALAILENRDQLDEFLA
jgi:hypothetical protein